MLQHSFWSLLATNLNNTDTHSRGLQALLRHIHLTQNLPCVPTPMYYPYISWQLAHDLCMKTTK